MIEDQWGLNGIASEIGQATNDLFCLFSVDAHGLAACVIDAIDEVTAVGMIGERNQVFSDAVLVVG
jgi:hypothetical protein